MESFELSQRRCSIVKQKGEQSVALTLCTRAVSTSDPDVLVTHLAIERAGDYDLIGRPVVHDGLVRLQTHVECVSHVLLYCSQSEPRATGDTSHGLDGNFDLALSNHCGFFRASVFLERSLLEHSETRALERRCAVVLCVQEDHQSTSCLSALFTRVHTSKRSAPRHCALQMCSIARIFAHQASMYVI